LRAASKPSSPVSHRHFSSLPAIPTTRAALDLPYLAGKRAHSAGRRGNDEGFSRLGPADIEKREICRDAHEAEEAQVCGERDGGVVGEHLQPAAVRQGVILPPQCARNVSPFREPGVPGTFDNADGDAPHDLANGDRGQVPREVRDPPSHGGVERKVEIADKDLSLRRLR
jgi:hypothetical protein